MNKLALILVSILIGYASFSQKPIKNNDKEVVMKNVVKWADSVFYFHENYRFEQFHAFYTEEFEIAMLREEMYANKLTNLEKRKAKGFYKKTDAEYEIEHQKLVDKNKELKAAVESFTNRVDYYQIYFWSNIKTNHGITVYYSHEVKLDNNYHVTSAVIKSEIGKKNDKTKILYASEVKKKK